MCLPSKGQSPENSNLPPADEDVFDRTLIYVVIALFVLWIAVGVWYLVKTIRADNSPLVKMSYFE